MSYSKLLSLSCIGGLTLSLCANAQQGQRKWCYVGAPSANKLGGNLVDPNRGNRAALCSWVDEDQHTTTLLVGVKAFNSNSPTIKKIVYNLTEPDKENYEKVNIDLEGLTPRNIFRSPENVLYLAANNGKSSAEAKGGVWVSIDGNTWLKLGDYRNDGHITFSVKQIRNSESTAVQVKIPGVEKTDIFTADTRMELSQYWQDNNKLFASSKYDQPKQIPLTEQWFIGITTVNSNSKNIESVGECLVSSGGTTSGNILIVSGNTVKEEINPDELHKCQDGIDSESLNMPEICSNVKGNTICANAYNGNKAKINQLEEQKKAAEKEKEVQKKVLAGKLELKSIADNAALLKHQKEIDTAATIIAEQESIIEASSDKEIKIRTGIDQLRGKGKTHDKQRAAERILADNEAAIQKKAKAVKVTQKEIHDNLVKTGPPQCHDYDANITNSESKIKEQQDIIDKIDAEQKELRKANIKACNKAPNPQYKQYLESQVAGNSDSPYTYGCVATYDNSGYITSSRQGNKNYSSQLSTCGAITESSLPGFNSRYDHPQEVIAQNNGSMAIITDNNEIRVTNNGEASSQDCKKINSVAFGPCSIKRVMITGIHPTLAWSHSDTATTIASKRYNGVFLALGQSPSTSLDNRLGVYSTPIDIEATREHPTKNFFFCTAATTLGGTLTGEPAAKVIWWWQKEDSKGLFQNIKAIKTENNNEEMIDIQTDATNKTTVYISEFDENGKKQIPTYIAEGEGRYRLMASTVIGGFVCDRNSDNKVQIAGSYYEAIGSPTEVIEVTTECTGSKKVKNRQVEENQLCNGIDDGSRSLASRQEQEQEQEQEQGQGEGKEKEKGKEKGKGKGKEKREKQEQEQEQEQEEEQEEEQKKGNINFNSKQTINTTTQNIFNNSDNNNARTDNDITQKNTQIYQRMEATINGAASVAIENLFNSHNDNDSEDEIERKITKAIEAELDKKLDQITKDMKAVSDLNEERFKKLSVSMDEAIQKAAQDQEEKQKKHGHHGIFGKLVKALKKPACRLAKWTAEKVPVPFVGEIAKKVKC